MCRSRLGRVLATPPSQVLKQDWAERPSYQTHSDETRVVGSQEDRDERRDLGEWSSSGDMAMAVRAGILVGTANPYPERELASNAFRRSSSVPDLMPHVRGIELFRASSSLFNQAV
jgi:hypothetical protein